MSTLKPGAWVKLVQGQTVINGYIRQATATYVTIYGMPPLPLKNWEIVIYKESK